MSARSKRGSAPKLRARAVGVPQSSVSTAVTSAQELKAEVERLRSVFSDAKDAHVLDPTPELAKIVAKAEMDLTNAVIRMCQAAADAAPDSEVATRELNKAKADKLLMAAKLKVSQCDGVESPDSQSALSKAKIGVLSAELDVLRAEYLIRHLDSSDVDANACADVIDKYREFVKAKAQLDVEKHKAAADLEAEKREAAAKLKADERKAAVELEAGKKLAAAKLAVEERKADLAVARAMYLFTHPGSSEADADASVGVRQAKAALAVEDHRVSVVEAQCAFILANFGSTWAAADASVGVRQAKAELAVEVHRARFVGTQCAYILTHPGSSETDANASVDVIDKYREFVKANAQLDVEKHKAVADIEAEKREAAAKRKVGERKADLDAAQSACILSSHSTEAAEQAIISIRDARKQLKAEERKVSVELDAEKKQAAAKLAVEKRKTDLAVARAMYLFTHPGSSEAEVDASIDVHKAKAELAVEECQAAVVAAEVRLLTMDRASRVKVDWSFQDVCRNLETLMEAKLRRDMPAADLRVKECEAAAAERDASISLGADLESKTAFPSDLATREDAVPEAESVVKHDLASCPKVESPQQKLRMAEMERDMLRLQHEVEMHGTVFSAAKSACRLLFPDLDEADVAASDFVLPSLHRLRKAEADRGVAKAQLLIARILDRVCLTRDDMRSPDSELSRAEVAKCEAIVAAARAAHHCANLGSTDAAANASPDVRLAVAELEVAERQVAVDAVRATMFRRGLSEKDADASPDVRLAVAELEVAKRQVAVDAARATMFRRGLSEKDADASTDVVVMLQALHKAKEDRRVLPAQIKVDACDAAVAAALFELFTGVKMPNFSDLKTKLENLAEAKGVMAMQRAMSTVEEKRDAVKDQKLQLELKVDMFSAKLADANACTKDPLVKDVALQLVTYLNSWLESAVADKNMFIAKQQILECEAALDAAKIDFVSAHPDVIAASKTVSEKLKLLDEAKSTVAILERKEIANRSIWYFGLPGPLVPSGSARPAASSPAVPGLKVVGATMAAVSPLPRILPTLPKLWCALSKKVVSSKFDVFCAVASTLEEVADLVLSQATLSSHYQLLHLVPGFGVLRDDILKKLAAIVDVKFPGTLEKPFGETGHDQIYMDLVIAFQNYECAAPLGILTSYNHWQFCWLEQASLIAEATSIDEVKQFSVQPPSVPSLKLCVSEVFSFDDPQLVKFLVSFLLKVCATPPGLPSRVLTHHYTETGSGPKANGPERSALKLYQMVRDDASDFFAVRLLDYGAEGVVLLMATETGACCAVKTPLPTQNALSNFITMIESDPRKLMVDEREAWENAYPLKDYPDVKVRVMVLNNSPALIMPFYEQLSDDDWENPDTVSMVREHIHALALRGVFHRDVQRRHVVWAHGREDVRLIDWGRISTASGKSCDPKTFTDDSMRRLCDG